MDGREPRPSQESADGDTNGNVEKLLSRPDSDDELVYDFQLFIRQLRTPSAEPILGYTRSFLQSFVSKKALWTASEQQKLVKDFKCFIFEKLRVYEPFKSLDSAKFRNAQEGIEKLVMGKLYTHCYSVALSGIIPRNRLDEEHERDLVDDETLCAKITEYKFIDAKYLDICGFRPVILDRFTRISGEELAKINGFKAPRDKMVCILNCCKVIFGIMKYSNDASSELGADSFIPLLIYTILKSNVQNLVSNIRYIERFRAADFLRGESSYYLSSLQAALNFILQLNESSLTIENKEEYLEAYQENQQQIQQKQDEISVVTPPFAPAKPVASPLFSKVTEFLGSTLSDWDHQPKPTEPAETTPPDDMQAATIRAQLMEAEDNRNTFANLKEMFPALDADIIEDVCRAKKYRIGVCVDVLLSLLD